MPAILTDCLRPTTGMWFRYSTSQQLEGSMTYILCQAFATNNWQICLQQLCLTCHAVEMFQTYRLPAKGILFVLAPCALSISANFEPPSGLRTRSCCILHAVLCTHKSDVTGTACNSTKFQSDAANVHTTPSTQIAVMTEQ